MLSNKATPKYYGIFREKVRRGEIPVCETISLQMNRIDRMIEDPRYWYDDKAIDGYIAFCENELTLTDGSDLTSLLDTFKLWAEDVLSWFEFQERSVFVPDKDGRGGHYEKRYIKKRLRNKQFLIVARRNAKSFYGSTMQNYTLNVDKSSTYQVAVAPTMKQAEEVLTPIRISIARARGPWFKFLTEGSLQNTTGNKADRVKLASTKKGIENFLNSSLLEIRPMSIDKLQGMHNKLTTIDEWLSGAINEDVVGAVEQGASKVDDYLILAISSEGTVRNGPGDTIKLELMDILTGEYQNDHVSIWWYQQDKISEINEPALWMKSNPNLGVTVSYETIQIDVERASKAPAARNDILAKVFGIPMEGYTYFFRYEETLTKPINESLYHCQCAMGADLSQGDDFCAFTFLFPKADGTFAIKVRSYITALVLSKLPGAMRMKYDEFIQEGSLFIMNDNILNMQTVYEDLMEYIRANDWTISAFGYDPYNSDEFLGRWIPENGIAGVEKVIQGAKTESVPLGELKILAEADALIFNQKLMQFCMGNSIVVIDNNGNMKLSKQRRSAKIDNVAALLDAFVAYKKFREAF